VRQLLSIFVLITLACLSTEAQDEPGGINMHGLSDMTGMSQDMQTRSSLWIDIMQQRATSGTDAEPNSTPLHMLMTTQGNWTLMFHGEAFLNEFQQTGPRPADKLFSTNWFMQMAQRKAGSGMLTLRAMLSLEPARSLSDDTQNYFSKVKQRSDGPSWMVNIPTISSWN